MQSVNPLKHGKLQKVYGKHGFEATSFVLAPRVYEGFEPFFLVVTHERATQGTLQVEVAYVYV